MSGASKSHQTDPSHVDKVNTEEANRENPKLGTERNKQTTQKAAL